MLPAAPVSRRAQGGPSVRVSKVSGLGGQGEHYIMFPSSCPGTTEQPHSRVHHPECGGQHHAALFKIITCSGSRSLASALTARGEQAVRGEATPRPRQGPIRHSEERFLGEIGWPGSWVDVRSGGESVLPLVPTGPANVRCIGDSTMFLGF